MWGASSWSSRPWAAGVAAANGVNQPIPGSLKITGYAPRLALISPATKRLAVSGKVASVHTGTSATVHASGARIDIVFSSSVALVASELTVTVEGFQVPVSSVTGSGTSWSVFIGRRWIRAGAAVGVTRLGQVATVTNSSTVSDEQIRYVGNGFGMFVHFNMSTFTGGAAGSGEWGTGNESPNTFAPTASVSDGIDQWIACALSAGMKYIILTAKHISGFCLWPTAQTPHSIASSSWYSANGSPDIVGLFTAKARAAGLRVGLYFCVRDFSWENRNPSLNTASATFANFTQAQLTELLTKYGPLDSLWIDGWGYAPPYSAYGVPFSSLPFATLHGLMNNLQPRCVMLVNNYEQNTTTSDIAGFEAGTVGYQTPVGNLLVSELCDTIRVDDKWFWGSAADAGLSVSTIISDRDTYNARRSAYLLNVPPATDAKIPAHNAAALAAVGGGAFEDVRGISKAAGTAARRTITLTLTTNGIAPAANLSGLSWAFWDQATPAAGIPPLAQGKGATTNAGGVFTVSIDTSLTVGAVGWLTVTDSDGTTTQSPSARAFSGPVVVA